MNNLIITSPDDLKLLITEAVHKALQTYNEAQSSHKTSQSNPGYLTISEAALYLNLAKQTLYTFTSTRTIPFIKRAKRILFTKGDLDEWLAEGKKKSVSQIKIDIKAGKTAA